MRIKNVAIKNFRTLKDVEIDFSEVTTFVGPNGVGKSTILKALDWYFNGIPGQITEEDCSFGNTAEDIEVRVTFDELSDKDREKLGKYVTPETTTFTAWKTLKPDGEEKFSANAMSFPEFAPIRSATKANEKKAAYKELQGSRPELELPNANTANAINDAMVEWEDAHPGHLKKTPEALQTNFFGFNSQGVMSGLFDFVLVTADLRASEEASDGKSSIIGRILEKTIDRSEADDEISRIIEESREKQKQVYEGKFNEQLESLGQKIGNVIDSFSKGRSITVKPSDIELKAPKTVFEVSVVDAGVNTEVSKQGHGFQRTLLVASLQVLAESSGVSGDGVICLAIEEPELYQHPIQARVFAKVLRSLAMNPNRGIQVAYATHSPYFLESKYFYQVRRLIRHNDERQEVQVFSVNPDDIKAKLTGIVKQKAVETQLDAMARGTLAQAIFANRVLLVEGTSDSAVMYGIGDRDEVGSLESQGLEIVPVGSKTNICLGHAILSGLGIPTYTLFDGDSGFEERARLKDKDEEEIEEEKKGHVSINRKLLKYFDLPEVEFPEEQISDNVAIFEDRLESFLEDNWPEWVQHKELVERVHGLNLSKNHDAYRSVTTGVESEPPAFLTEVIYHALGSPGDEAIL